MRETNALKKLIEGMISKTEYDAEIARLQRIIDSQVSKAKHDSLLEESAGHRAQVERLQASLHDMVPKSLYESAQDDATRNSVPRIQLEAAKDEIKRHEMEIQRLKKCMEGMVFRVQLESLQDEKLQCSQEIKCLQERIQGLVPAADVSRAEEEIQCLKLELSRTRKLVEEMVSPAQYNAVQAEVKRSATEIERCETEVQRLSRVLEDCVPKGQLALAQDELARSRQEAKLLQDRLDNMVSKAELAASASQIEELNSEIGRLHAAMGGMVAKPRYDALANDLQQSQLEAQRLKALTEAMVPKVQFDTLEDERARIASECDLLKERLQNSVPRAKCSVLEDDVAGLRAHVAKLQASMSSDMVAKAKYEEALDDGQRASQMVERLQRKLEDMAPKSELEMATGEAARAAQQIAQLQERQQAMVAKSELATALADTERLRSEISRLQKVVEGMVQRTQLEAAQDETRRCEMEIERLKRSLECSVPKTQFEAVQDERQRCSNEIEHLQARLKVSVSRDDLKNAEAEVQRLTKDVVRMKHEQQEEMVPKQQHEALQERLDTYAALHQKEIESMKKLLEKFIPRVDHDAEIARLQRIIDGQIPRAVFESLNDEYLAVKAQIDKMQCAMRDMVSRSAHDAVLEEIERQAKDTLQVQHGHAEAIRKLELSNVRSKEEVERLYQCMIESKNEEIHAKEKRILHEMDVLKSALAMKENDLKTIQDDIKQRDEVINSLKSDLKTQITFLDHAKLELAQSATKAELLQARTEAYNMQLKADESQQIISALENQISSLYALLNNKINKEDFVKAQKDANDAVEDLMHFKMKLENVGISDESIFDRLLKALKRSQVIDVNQACCFLENVLAEISLNQMDLLQELLYGAKAARLDDSLILLGELYSLPLNSLGELRRMIVICRSQQISSEQLFGICELLSGSVQGSNMLSVAELKALVKECSSIQEIFQMREKIQNLQQNLDECTSKCSSYQSEQDQLKEALDAMHHKCKNLEIQVADVSSLNAELILEVTGLKIPKPPIFASALNVTASSKITITDSFSLDIMVADPDSVLYYTVDSSDPSPDNHCGSGYSPVHVILSEPSILKAVCVVHGVSSAIRVMEFIPPEPIMEEESTKERLQGPIQSEEAEKNSMPSGGIGMLITRYHEDGVVEVRSLIEGGAASRDGRIRPGDKILAVGQLETRNLGKSEVLQLISGPVGTQVELKLMRASQVFDVTLIRTATIYNSEVRTLPGGWYSQNSEPNLAFILGPRTAPPSQL